MTAVIVGAIVLFIAMLLFPLVMSARSLKGEKAEALKINNDRVRNPRYFGISFAALMEKGLAEYDGSGKIRMSKEEALIEADKLEALPIECESIVYAKEKEFRPPAGTIFHKEIYTCQDAYLDGIYELRAIYGKKAVTLGAGTMLTRWADALGPLRVEEHANLGISASSATQLTVGRDCTFRRLYAPSISLGWPAEQGQTEPESAAAMVAVALSDTVVRNIQYVDDDQTDENGELAATVISKHAVTVLEGLTVRGHIRSHKSITLYDGAVVYGNLFAEGDIYLGENVKVYGNIFTQQKIITQRGVQIGQFGEIKSVIARDEIIFGADCKVYGYVSSETRGRCCPDADMVYLTPEEEEELRQKWRGNLRRTAVLPVMEKAVFKDAAEFDEMSTEVFRKNRYLKETVIPEGVQVIRRGFFFDCENLEKVVLPNSLKEIEDFAFYGCKRLSKIDLSACGQLRRIGESAFEGCAALRAVALPGSLAQLGAAAFSGCSALGAVQNLEHTHLTQLQGHVFLDCAALKSAALPEGIGGIGISAFKGCKALREMVLPRSVSHIEAFAFSGCEALRQIVLQGELAQLDERAKKGLPEGVRVLEAESKTAAG
ncbi:MULTISPECIES: leucine-rich repeat protein [unclassified Clostridium]|uniref:leucine-rich repeat protein n=1 Tax=unclassified Clostridium TaxID=2614128 RepID=UPI0011064EAA|nr:MULTISPECIES: leucine-rich repeat protein [unclassified Clostridium]